MSAAVHVRFALWLVVAAALVSLASVSTAAAADAVVPRCHVDVNRFSGSTTSVGVWAGLRYDVRYTMKLCSSDSNVGTATITLNGERRNETSRSGTVTITGSGIVHYQVTGPSTGAQVFSSSLCWSATNCTTLCDGVTLGSVGDCTVEKTVMPTMIALFWLVPAAVCGSVLVAFYVKKRKEEREAVLEQRDRDLLTTREDRERGEMRPMTTARPVPSESDDADTVAVEVAPEPREASEHSAVDIVIEDDSAVRRAAEAEMERDRERDRAAADAADAADAAACMQKKSEELVVREHQQARDAVAQEEQEARHDAEAQEAATRSTLREEQREHGDRTRQAENAAAAAAEEVLWENVRSIEDGEARGRVSIVNDEVSERAVLAQDRALGADTVRRAEADAAASAARMLRERTQAFGDNEAQQRHVAEQEEQRERDALISSHDKAAAAIREAEAAAASQKLAQGVRDLGAEEAAERDAVAKEEEDDRAQIVSDCQDGAEAIQADEAAAAAAEKLAQDVRDLDTQEAAERDAIARQEEEGRAPLSAERDGGADTIRAAEDAAAAQKFADDVDALEKEEAADRAGVLEEEAEARRSLEAAQAQAEALANAMNALIEDEADDRKDVESNEHDARRRIARDRGNEAKSIKDAEAEAVRRAAAIAAAAAVLASCADEEVDRRERIVAAEAAAAIPLPCVGQELTARAAIVGEEAARRDSVNREERQAGDKARAAEATRKALEDLERQEAAEREAAAKEEPSARAVLLSLKNASLRRIAAKADAAKLQMADCVKEEAAARTEVEDDEEGAWDSMQKSHGRAVKENAKKDVLDATKNYNDEYKALMQKVVDDEDEDDSEPPMPFIGFSLTEDILKGVLIVDGLYKDGPAYQTGIRIGDTLLRIQAKPVRTIAEARFVVGTACSVGRVAPITLVTPTGRQYTVALWIMTAERRFAGKPYFFDVHKHEKLESPGRKSIVEGVEGLRTPSSSRTGSRAHTPRTGQKTPDASRSSRPSPSDNRSAFRTTPRTSVSDSAAADARRRETGSPRSSTTPSSRATATYDANEQTLTPALVAEAERARREAERAARRERSSRR